MELYQNVLDRLFSQLKQLDCREYPYDPANCWPETERFELVMGRDSAYELGASPHKAANYTAVTGSDHRFEPSRVIVAGKDLPDLKGDVSYARLAVLSVDEAMIEHAESKESSEKTFRILQKLDFIKYHVYAQGYMIRTSTENFREQVRVSKEAIKNGITFEKVGNSFLKHYLETEGVKSATVIFITDPAADYDLLLRDARKVHEITMTLSRILEGIPTDCSLCSLKPICDEVEGMRELHFGKEGMR